MADNKRGRGDRDENQENPSECKNAKQVLREVTSFLSVCKSEPDQPAAEQIRLLRYCCVNRFLDYVIVLSSSRRNSCSGGRIK